MGVGSTTRFARLRASLRREDGTTIFELIIVMTILLLVLTPLVGSFTSALKHEADQSEREAAYSSARLAIQRMRADVHCASGISGVEQNLYGGFTLTVTEAVQGSAGWCETVIPSGTGASGVQWCTIPVSGSTTRFRLYRYLGLDPNDCDGGPGSTFQIDYVATPAGGWPTYAAVAVAPTDWVGNIWPTPAACPVGRLPTLSVLLNTSVNPDATPYRHYQLRDSLALRNALRCEV